MCTDACPCWQTPDPNYARTKNGKAKYESDAYSMYKKVGDDYLKKFGRVFDKKDSENGKYKPFVWTKTPADAVETFMECFNKKTGKG